MPEIKKINHIAILVEDMDNSLEFWHAILGIKPSQVTDVLQEAARIAFLPVGDSEIELVQPTTTRLRAKSLSRETRTRHASSVPRGD